MICLYLSFLFISKRSLWWMQQQEKMDQVFDLTLCRVRVDPANPATWCFQYLSIFDFCLLGSFDSCVNFLCFCPVSFSTTGVWGARLCFEADQMLSSDVCCKLSDTKGSPIPPGSIKSTQFRELNWQLELARRAFYKVRGAAFWLWGAIHFRIF